MSRSCGDAAHSVSEVPVRLSSTTSSTPDPSRRSVRVPARPEPRDAAPGTRTDQRRVALAARSWQSGRAPPAAATCSSTRRAPWCTACRTTCARTRARPCSSVGSASISFDASSKTWRNAATWATACPNSASTRSDEDGSSVRPEVLHQAGRSPVPARRDPDRPEPEPRTLQIEAGSTNGAIAGGRRAHRTRGSRSANPPCPRPARNPAGRRRHGRRRRCQRAGIRRPCPRSPVPAREHRSRNRTASAPPDATHRRRAGPLSRRGVIERPRRRRSRPGAAGCMPASARIPLASTWPSTRRPSERSWAAHFESASNRAQVSPPPGNGTRSRRCAHHVFKFRADAGTRTCTPSCSTVRWPQDMEESRATGDRHRWAP